MSNSGNQQPEGPEEEERTPEQPEEQQPAAEEARQEDTGGAALSEALQVSFRYLKLALVALVVVYLLNGIFWVSPGQVKIKLRFGQPVGVGPRDQHVLKPGSGWHIRWPWEQVRTIPTDENSITIDRQFWHFEPPGGQEMQQRGYLSPRRDGYLLTGDHSLMHMQLEARYRPRTDEQGALDYAFRVENPDRLLRRFVYESTIEVVGRNTISNVLTEGKQRVLTAIQNEVERRMRQFEERNGFTPGVELTSVSYTTSPIVPTAVQQAYQQARQAETQMNQMLTEASEQESTILQEGRRVKARVLGEARAYKTRVVELARADAQTLSELLKSYEKSPEMARIMRERHYERMVQKVLGDSQDAFVLHGTEPGNERELRILLGRQEKRRQQQTEGQQQQQQGQQTQQQQGQGQNPAQSGMRPPHSQ